MKLSAIFGVMALSLLLSCTTSHQDPGQKMKIIFETDLGNDVDDALAMDMLYKYIENEKIEVLAIMLNKNGQAPAEYADILNTFYGHQIPIGVIREGADCETDALNYAKAVCEMKDEAGRPMFERSVEDYSSLPDAHVLYRQILARQPEHSVTIVSVGFSTNLVRLMDTPSDKISSETGMELISSRVKQLVMMGGCFNNPDLHEYNIVKDIPAAQKIFSEWPGKVVTSPFEVGIDILYPGKSIENDFTWVSAHPVVEAYKSYLQMPYDRPTWDLTSLLFAVEGPEMFTVSAPGHIKVDEFGTTSFEEDLEGNRYYLMTSLEQDKVIGDHFVKMITAVPEKYR